MIEGQRKMSGKVHHAICDEIGCDSEENLDTDDFRAAVSALRGLGWEIKKIGNDWVHICPDCQQQG